MDELFYNLFGQPLGSVSGTQVALDATAKLLTGVALLLLARRNDLGWWAQVLSVFAGPGVVALLFGYEGLIAAVPMMAAAAYGLWRFSKWPLSGKFGREVSVRPFTVYGAVLGLILLAGMTALKLGPMLTTGFAFSDGTLALWLSLVLEAAVVVALVGIANGVRWAWLAIAAAAVAYIAVLFGNAPSLATLAVLVFQFGAAVYGWRSWRTLPAEAETAGPEAADDRNVT